MNESTPKRSTGTAAKPTAALYALAHATGIELGAPHTLMISPGTRQARLRQAEQLGRAIAPLYQSSELGAKMASIAAATVSALQEVVQKIDMDAVRSALTAFQRQLNERLGGPGGLAQLNCCLLPPNFVKEGLVA